MTTNRITEFSVLVPSELAHHSDLTMQRFKAYLEVQFPGYMFTIASFVRIPDSRQLMDIEDWLVIPHMGTIGDRRAFRMPPMPHPDLIQAITQCCKDYGFDARAGMVA